MTEEEIAAKSDKSSDARPENEIKKPDSDMVVVGIGSSAGGLEALRSLLPTLPIQKNLTYVIAQHMDPRHDTMLGQILERDTKMKVVEIFNGQRLISGMIHITPPGMDACMEDGRIKLEPSTGIGPKPSLDRFFISLAKHQEGKAIGIILSGTGTDGAHGLHAIKDAGGITIAQEEATAKFSSMPHAAIGTGHVDIILAPEKIGGTLPDLVKYPRILPIPAENDAPPDNFSKIFRLILDQTGGDFHNYKMSTVRRRIERRMAVNKLHSFDDYVALLGEMPEEVEELHKDLLISVTVFFRDKAAFKGLEKTLNPLVSAASGKEEIRIWVAGCATGEEAYSIAILLREKLGKRVNHYNVQIFASDMDDNALAIARHGVYPKAATIDIDPKLLKKYFLQQGESYRLNPDIRDMILFAHHDLVKDPPFSHLNMVTCRNVLIYFNNTLQKRVLQSFHYALEPKGILFLGKSETSGAAARLFQPLQRQLRIYQRNEDVKAHLPHLTPLRNGREHDDSYTRHASKKQTSVETLKALLLGIYEPNCVLLDEQLDVTYIRGDVSAYVAFTEGRAVLNILDLVRNEFRHDLRGLLYKARREHATVRSRRFKLDSDSANEEFVTMIAQYSSNVGDTTDRFLLLFERTQTEKPAESDSAATPEDLRRIRELEDELRESRESLQTTIEELETANEELQSTYEEAQSTNEELFSSTEELQTSNEELQSTNEELRTVNEELSIKSADVEVANGLLKKVNQQLATEVDERTSAEERLVAQEQKLRTIIDSEPAWVNICDADGRILEVNPAGMAMMDANSANQLIGKRLDEFVLDDYKGAVRQCRAEAHEAGMGPMRAEIEIRTLKGNPRWLEASTVLLPVANEADEARMMSIICDHTERKLAQDQAMQRQAELAQLMRLNTLGEMASGLAHELNQPLSAISNFISGCERRLRDDSCDKDEMLKVLHVASQQAQVAGNIVKQVRDFVTDDDVEHDSVNVNEVIKEAVELIRGTGEYSDINFVYKLSKELPAISVNKVQIEQVLINLMRNGIESMRDSGVKKPELIIRSKLSGKNMIRIAIDDIGGGLPDSKLGDMFKPFFTTKAKGMGMGLSISRSIIEAHASKLEGKNRKNGGVTFSFKLPLAEEGKDA